MKRDMPLEKIRAIVARGNGVPDPDCPGIPSLMRFWVSTSTKEIDTEEIKQQSNVRLQADASSTLAATFADPSSTTSSRSIGADGMQQILQSLQPAATDDTGLWFQFFFFCADLFLPTRQLVGAVFCTH